MALLRIIDEATELRQRRRLYRLLASKHSFSTIAAAFFFGLAGMCAYFLIALTWVTPLTAGTGESLALKDWLKFWGMMGVFIAGFGAGGFAFVIGIAKDPILKWFFRPNDYVFARGTVRRSEFLPGSEGGRKNSRIRVTIESQWDGLSAYFFEEFDPRSWPFAQRRELSIPAYVLIPRRSGVSPALVGIEAGALDPVARRSRTRRAEGARVERVMLGVFIAVAVVSALASVVWDLR